MVRPITAILQSMVTASVLVRVFIAVKGHHGDRKTYKDKLLRAALQFKSLVHYCHVRKYGAMQEDMVQERQLSSVTLGLA